MKALCTGAALHGLRRRYPQIYTSSDKLELDVSSIQLSARDFYKAVQKIIPASQRCVRSPGKSLTFVVRPLLLALFEHALDLLQKAFLSSVPKYTSKQNKGVFCLSTAITWFVVIKRCTNTKLSFPIPLLHFQYQSIVRTCPKPSGNW